MKASIVGLILTLVVLAIAGTFGSLTLWTINTLCRSDLPYTLRTVSAAAVFNLFAAWIGSGPWFFLAVKRGE